MTRSSAFRVVVALVIAFGAGAAAMHLIGGRRRPVAAVRRPYFETLDLASPEGAVREFVAAWRADDFITAYLVLAPETQYAWYIRLSVGRLDSFVSDTTRLPKIEGRPTEYEQALVAMGCFRTFTRAAKRADALPIDLDAEIRLGDREELQSREGRTLVDLTATSESEAHRRLVFRVVKGPNDRWRLLYVMRPTEGETPAAWPVPADDERLPQR